MHLIGHTVHEKAPMQALHIHAGPKALAHIRAHGLQAQGGSCVIQTEKVSGKIHRHGTKSRMLWRYFRHQPAQQRLQSAPQYTYKASLLSLPTIDALTASINNQIVQGANSATFTTALLGVYTQQDGRSKAAMADLLAAYAASNLQLGRWSLLGCVDDPIPTKGCTKFQAAALVINGAGQAVGGDQRARRLEEAFVVAQLGQHQHDRQLAHRISQHVAVRRAERLHQADLSGALHGPDREERADDQRRDEQQEPADEAHGRGLRREAG